MIRNKKIICLTLAVLLALSTQVYAANPGPLTKIGRGVTNIVTCFGEYIYQIPRSVEQTPDYFSAAVVDVVRGTGFTIFRAVTGVYDVLTFPFPGANNYESIIKPDTVFDKLP